MKKLLSILLAVVMAGGLFTACSKTQQTPVERKDFRVTAYVVADTVQDLKTFDAGHLDEVTDIIYISASDFDTEGNIILKDNFQKGYDNLKKAIGDRDINFYCNLIGPPAVEEHDDWYDTMADQAEQHNLAFQSGNLEGNILEFLRTHEFDGVFFDYEYAIKAKYWKVYNSFIVSLRETLGEDYKIGMALSGWDLGQSKEAREATDFIELMTYGIWDENDIHSSMENVKSDIKLAKKAGYDMSKVDLGVPFFARPTDHSAVWYDYKDYYDKIDENGLGEDKERGLTYSFNTYDVMKEKTAYAIEQGCGGVMIWHYSCDAEYGNDKSLFKAINEVKNQ